ncbi:MAG: hypothetical protein Ta2F_16890 [Termitinemataceae bacterium]|nr:MAG: hypothetical protein Ta2F_16890 [Termitinemataceae bacterium]
MYKKLGVLIVAMGASVFVACATSTVNVAVTPSLIDYVGQNNLDLGINEKKFYFYLSQDIHLEHDEIGDNVIKFENGVAIPVEQKFTEIIEIKKSTPGLAFKNMMTEAAYVTYTPLANEVKVTVEKDGKQIRSYTMDDKGGSLGNATVTDLNPSITYRLLGVSFEVGDGRLIGFAASMLNPDGTFDILFDDEKTNSVLYDGKMYRVVYQEEEKPYLMIKLGKEAQDLTQKKRVASGLPYGPLGKLTRQTKAKKG